MFLIYFHTNSLPVIVTIATCFCVFFSDLKLFDPKKTMADLVDALPYIDQDYNDPQVRLAVIRFLEFSGKILLIHFFLGCSNG